MNAKKDKKQPIKSDKETPGEYQLNPPEENPAREENPNWDQAQRRQQASPRSYTTNVDTENIENQNSEAHKEQIENPEDQNHNQPKDVDKKDGELLGDKISQRQQTIDEKNPPEDNKTGER